MRGSICVPMHSTHRPVVRASAYKTRVDRTGRIYTRTIACESYSRVHRVALVATARNDKEKLSRTDGAEGRRWENDLCKDAENERERERERARSSHEEEMRGRRKETRCTLGSKMHIAPRWIVQKLGRIRSSRRSLPVLFCRR